MPDDRSFFSEPDHDLDGTQPVERIDTSRHLPPPPGHSHVQLPARPQSSRREKHKRDQRKPVERKQKDVPRDPRKSGLYLPAWSVLLMLVTVFIVAFGIVALVIGLGGGSQPDGSPRIIIITAEPSNTPSEPTAEPTRPLLPDQSSQGEVQNFALEGPTLPPVILSPTPLTVMVGSMVVVNASGGLNVRAGAGLDHNIMFNADFGAVFEVEDGPQQANGLTWWMIRDPMNSSRFGWAAADYLDVQAAQ